MKPALTFVCPLTRDDFVGEGTLQHCPQCNLDIPDMTALTEDEARRVLDAFACGMEHSPDLKMCSSYSVDAHGDSVHFAPEKLDTPGIDLSLLVDSTPKLLLAVAALSALGLTAQIHVFNNILTPLWQGHEVFVLDEDGPRFVPDRADAFAGAVDASEDAWLTFNLAIWRRDAINALGHMLPLGQTVEEKFDGGRGGLDHDIEF